MANKKMSGNNNEIMISEMKWCNENEMSNNDK